MTKKEQKLAEEKFRNECIDLMNYYLDYYEGESLQDIINAELSRDDIDNRSKKMLPFKLSIAMSNQKNDFAEYEIEYIGPEDKTSYKYLNDLNNYILRSRFREKDSGRSF